MRSIGLQIAQILLVCINSCAFAATIDNEKTTSLGLLTHLYGEVVDAPAKKARVAGTIVELDFVKRLHETVSVRINGGLRLEGGSSRALYDDEFAPRQTPLLREASLTWLPWEECQLSGGSLNQNILGSPLMVQDQSFPGVREACGFKFGRFGLGAEAEQTYATDTQFTHPTGRSLQSDAQFFIERLNFSYLPADSVTVQAHVAHYLFSGLSSLVAYQSQFMGNTASGLDDKNADFSYEYQPIEFGLEVKAKFTTFDLGLRGETINNPGAPGDKNKAWQVAMDGAFKRSPRYVWNSTLRYYHIDSDATPSYFNDPSTAHANMSGIGAEVKLTMPEDKVEAALTYTISHPIAKTLYQAGDQSWAFAVLRLHYDIL